MTGNQFVRRLTAVLVVVWGAATVVFIVLRVVPGSAVDQISGLYGTAEQRVETRRQLGLDHSIFYQYWLYLKGALRFDFGRSFYSGRPVTDILVDTMPVTIELAIAAGLIMLTWGILAGSTAAVFRNTKVDVGLRGLAAVFFSIPWFFSGVLLLILFTSVWKVLPGFGRLPPTMTYEPTTHFVLLDAVIQGRPELVWPWLSHILLPAAAIGLTTGGYIARITRASFLEVTSQDYIRTARSKGMTRRQLFRVHVSRNAALPIVAVAGLQVGALLGGAVVAEVVFSYPGVGKLMVDAINRRDYPVVQGAAFVVAMCYVLVNVATESSYPWLDPRLRR